MREEDIAMCVNAGCLLSIAAFSRVSLHFVHSRLVARLARTLGPERKMRSRTLLMITKIPSQLNE
jgi:hypothetical protein